MRVTHQIIGTPPARLHRALMVIGGRLYPLAAKTPAFRAQPERLRISCVFLALSVRDALRSAGFQAEVRSVALAVEKAGVRQVVIGSPADRDAGPGSWAGHLVVLAEGFLIDPSVGQARRPEWKDLTDILTAPCFDPPRAGSLDEQPMTLLSALIGRQEGVRMLWYDSPENQRWEKGGDARPDRRYRLVEKLTAALRQGEAAR